MNGGNVALMNFPKVTQYTGDNELGLHTPHPVPLLPLQSMRLFHPTSAGEGACLRY